MRRARAHAGHLRVDRPRRDRVETALRRERTHAGRLRVDRPPHGRIGLKRLCAGCEPVTAARRRPIGRDEARPGLPAERAGASGRTCVPADHGDATGADASDGPRSVDPVGRTRWLHGSRFGDGPRDVDDRAGRHGMHGGEVVHRGTPAAGTIEPFAGDGRPFAVYTAALPAGMTPRVRRNAIPCSPRSPDRASWQDRMDRVRTTRGRFTGRRTPEGDGAFTDDAAKKWPCRPTGHPPEGRAESNGK